MSPRVAVIAVLTLALVSSVLTSLAVPSRSFSHSSYNADPFGTKLLYRLVEDTGRPVERWRDPLTELAEGGSTDRGVLVMAAPFARRLRHHEAEAILDWVERGNGLLLAATQGAPWTVRGEDANDWALLEALGFGEPPALREWEQTVLVTAPRLEIASRLTPVLESPLLRDLAHLEGGSLVRTDAPHGPWVALLQRTVHPHSWIRDHGAGRIAVLVEPGLVENRLLGEGDNHRFVLRLLDRLRDGGTVWFEETVHGHLVRPDVPWSDFGLRRILTLQLLVVVAIYVAARAPRLGRPRPGLARSARSTVELADSMAALYGLAGVRRDAVAALWHHAEREGQRHPEAARALEALAVRAAELTDGRRLRDRDLLEFDEALRRALHEGSDTHEVRRRKKGEQA